MSISDAQKSEVHDTTADASSSPTADGDSQATRRTTGAAHAPWNRPQVNPAPPANVEVIRDDTDAGGPLVVESDDPDLNPPQVIANPFPTERTPEIDP